MIISIHIKNYKCYENEFFEFRSGVNLLVGENDSGKSTVLDAIRIFSGDKILEDLDNHSNSISTTGRRPIEITINKDGLFYRCKKEEGVEVKYYKQVKLQEIKDKFDNDTITTEEAKEVLSTLGVGLQGMRTTSQMKSKFAEYITSNSINIVSNPIKEIEVGNSIINKAFTDVKYEDGKKFQNIQDNFKSFVKDSVNTIWDKPTSGSTTTIRKSIEDNLDLIKTAKESDYRNNMLPTIQEIMPEVVDIQMTLKSSLSNFSGYDAQIDFINGNGAQIPIDRKGDGTRRRVTLAMFKIESNNNSESKIYLLDEPDTHLNLRVQQDLVKMFENLAGEGHQVIFTTHSPFILNLMSINDIIMIKHDGIKSSKVDTNLTNPDDFELTIYNLGIQNIDIFFSKYFLFFEGDTEKEFFSRAYQKRFGTTIEKKFIRQIIADGIDNEAIFIANFQKIVGEKIKIICVVDSDYAGNRKSKGIIDSMELKYNPGGYFNKFALGNKEFEDLFDADILYNCFLEEISLKFDSKDKFEDLLTKAGKKSEFISSVVGLGKPEIGRRLAEYISFEDLHKDLKSIINHIYSLT